MAIITPNPGFDWSRVRWGRPDEVVSERCSYCNAPLGDTEEPDYQIPLIISTEAGSVAQFCMLCQERWWGRAS